MKKQEKLMIILGLCSNLFFSSCTDDFDKINTNPKALTTDALNSSNIGKLFSQTNFSVMSHTPIGTVPWIHQVTESLYSDIYAQYYATTQPRFPTDRYALNGGWNDWAWRSTFERSAPALRLLINETEKLKLPVENAIAKVWEVYQFQRATDYYGPIPYTQFGNGETSVPYDSQESIYKSFFPILDEAVAILSQGGTSIFASEDLIYGGDVSKWNKFANTLRLRIAMRIRHVEPSLAQTEAEKAVTAGVMEVNGDNAFVSTNPQTPHVYSVISSWGEFRMSASMESVLKGYRDPRIGEMFSPATKGDSDADGIPYEGIYNGQSIAALEDGTLDYNNTASDVGPRFLPGAGGLDGIPVIRSAEAHFLRAEGVLIGWNMGGGTAKSYYEDGINESLAEWGVTNMAYATSTNVPAVAIPGDTATSDIPVLFDETNNERALEQIHTQKWISLYPESREAWAELRRTGYPKLYPRLFTESTNLAVGDIKRRMVYPPIEFNRNADAVNAAIASPELGGSEAEGSKKLWWDKR